ncbi:MAG: 30S ribosomal protein S2 [Candidatus Aenigmarchaeota archaeon]|nr:30S ribosomal protein S2 [Candidatus Aenigmarchaeota archaeon]
MPVKKKKRDITEQMLVERTQYLTAGVHIGMKTCTKYMKQFIYKIREDGLAVFNIQKVNERLKIAAKFLSSFDKIMIVSRKGNAQKAVKKFAEILDCKAVVGRFPPGTLTNPSFKDFYEPDVVFVIDPLIDRQAVIEARKKRLPVVALCDTFNDISDVDWVIPANNNGRKSIALILMILAREILKNKNRISKNEEFKYTLKDFGIEE